MGGISKIVSVGASIFGAAKAGSASSDASKASAAASAAQLEFERQKYEEWKEIYGDVERNLSTFYNSLTPTYYAVQGLEAFEKEQEAALTRVRENLAQRGITDSGIAAKAEVDFGVRGAEERAKIRAAAPYAAAEEKRNFLAVGLGKNPGSTLSSALADRASQASQTAEAAGRTAGSAFQSAVKTVGTALDDYFENSDSSGGTK